MSNEDHLQSMTNEWLHTVLKEIEKVPFSKQAKQSNVFEDTRIRLPCVGNCKSKINTLLLTDTIYKISKVLEIGYQGKSS